MTDLPNALQTDSPVTTRIEAFRLSSAGVTPLEWRDAMSTPPSDSGFVWFDVTQPTLQGLEALQHQYQLHPLAIEDAVHAHQRAKVETYPGFEFIVAHGVTRGPGSVVEIHELNVFAGAAFVITVRHGAGPQVSEILRRWERVPAGWRTDASSLVYVSLDALVDEYAPLADELERELRDVRQRLIDPSSHNEQELATIFDLTELVHAAHAVVFPLKDMLGTLMRVGPPVVSPEEVPYFRDIRDHAAHMAERLSLSRNMAERAFDIYHALENQRRNASGSQLTMVATVFFPLTLVTGFFGQNFSYLVDKILVGPRAFWILGVGFEALVAVVTIFFVQRIGSDRGSVRKRSAPGKERHG